MYSYESLKDKVTQAIRAEQFISEPKELYEPIRYTLSSGGKRLRPVLMLMACDVFGGDIEKALYPALGIEIFHNFTLLHDDIMDTASIRRGKPSVYKKWNSNVAILSGDTMFAMAYDYISKIDKTLLPDILKVFNKTAKQVCEGQQYDMNFEKDDNVSIKDYMKMIRLKTAVLIAASLKIGAIIGGANSRDIDNIYAFGENIGLAFQLKDDLLDVFGDKQKFGKKIGNDIITNKKTFLYLKALELAKGTTLNSLKYNFENNSIDDNIKIKSIKDIYEKLKLKEFTENEIIKYYQKAIKFLDDIRLSDKRKENLKSISKNLMFREY